MKDALVYKGLIKLIFNCKLDLLVCFDNNNCNDIKHYDVCHIYLLYREIPRHTSRREQTCLKKHAIVHKVDKIDKYIIGETII